MLLNFFSQYNAAKEAYQRVLEQDPNHAKVLQQLGWLHHQQSNSFASQDLAIEYLEKSVSSGRLFTLERLTCTLSNTNSHLKKITPTLRAGISWDVVTCRSRNTLKPMKRISKPFIETAATPHSGVRLVYYTTKSISIEML